MPDWSYQTVFRPLLFLLPPEQARALTLGAMGRLASLPLGHRVIEFLGHMRPPEVLQVEALGLRLVSPVGLDAGLDVHTQAPHALGRFGVGFLEIGPVTEQAVISATPVRRRETEEGIWYPDLPVNDGVGALKERLWRLGPLPVPAGIRLAHAPGASPDEAAAEQVRMIGELASFSAFFTVQIGTGSGGGWEEPMRRLVEAARLVRRPIFLCLAPDLPSVEAERWLKPALAAGIDGVVISGGITDGDGRLEGPAALEPCLGMLRLLRAEQGLTLPIIASGGAQSPADAVRLLEAGATMVSVHSGLVFAGPGLPKRINEAVAYTRRAQMAEAGSGSGWIWATLMGAGVLLVGLLALLVAVTSVILPYDETFVGLSKADLHRINAHLLDFMAHDRISLMGATAANGVLFMYLGWFGMRRGQHWARQVFLAGGAAGFLTFFLFLGFGYLDPLHLLAWLLLLPFYLLGLIRHRNVEAALPPSWQNDRTWRQGQWGQLLFVALGAGIMVTGLVISAIGVTFVLVPQDLAFMGTTAEALRTANPRLLPLIAHDRAGFGGSLVTNGFTILLISLWGFRQGERWIWWAMFASGTPSYVAALWTHLAIGYTDFVHLLPVYVAMALFVAALALSFRYLNNAAEGAGR